MDVGSSLFFFVIQRGLPIMNDVRLFNAIIGFSIVIAIYIIFGIIRDLVLAIKEKKEAKLRKSLQDDEKVYKELNSSKDNETVETETTEVLDTK